jgi:hypothetical protein
MADFNWRYLVGCAGMFATGSARAMSDQDEAFAACDSPPGCEVLDTATGEWLGPTCREEIDEAKARVAERERAR